MHFPIFTKLHRLHLGSTQNTYICPNLHILIAPPPGGDKCRFLRPAVLRLTGILTSCSTLDRRRCCNVRCASDGVQCTPRRTQGCEGPLSAAFSPSYYYCLRNLHQTTPIFAGTTVVGGNGAIWCSRTLASQNGSVAPPTTLQLHQTNGVILTYPDETIHAFMVSCMGWEILSIIDDSFVL